MGLKFSPGVQEYVRGLPPEIKRDIRAALEMLRVDPRDARLPIKVLRKDGRFLFMRARVRGYRIIYSPLGDDVAVWRIQHRSDGYEWFERFDP